MWREGNKCANWLAKEAARSQRNQGEIGFPPGKLKELIGADIIGVVTSRLLTV